MHLEEFEDKTDPKTRRYVMMRSIKDLGMGVLYLAIGAIILFAKQFRFQNDFALSVPAKIFAILAIIYGGWRVYRGIRKQYYR